MNLIYGGSVSYTHLDSIITTTKEKTDIEISHDTANALNTLSEIFDKKNIEEKQEYVNILTQVAVSYTHLDVYKRQDRTKGPKKGISGVIYAENTNSDNKGIAYLKQEGFTQDSAVSLFKEYNRYLKLGVDWKHP